MKAVGSIFRYRVLWILFMIALMTPVAILAQALQKGGQLPSVVRLASWRGCGQIRGTPF